MRLSTARENIKRQWRVIVVLGIAIVILLTPYISFLWSGIVNWLPTQDNCLFGLSGGQCSYDPLNGSVNLSLGEALAGVGLLLAITQLAEPIRKLTIKINYQLQRTAVVILAIGFIIILISSILPQLPVHYKIIGTPLTWEILGYFCFITAPIIYAYGTTRKTKLFSQDSKKAQKFYNELIGALGTGKLEYAEAALNIFMANADEIIRAAKLLAPYTSPFNDREEIPENLEYTKYANDLLVIVLSEPRIANLLATQRIDYLFYILELLRTHSLTSNSARTGMSKVFEQLFEDPNSHLHNQLERSGLTLYSPLYEFLFGDEYLFFVDQLHALSSWNRYGVSDEVRYNEKYVKIYIEALEASIKRYGFRNDHAVQSLNNALRKLREYAESISRLDDPYEKGKVSKNSSIMMAIESFFGHTFANLYNTAVKTGSVADYELNATVDEHGISGSLTGVYATNVAKLFEVYNMQDKEDDMVRIHLMSLTDTVLPIFDDDGDSSRYTNIRSRFFETIWKKIKENVEAGYYPVVLRYYLQLLNWEGDQPQWRKDERNNLYSYMKKELVPRLVKGEHMANGDLKEKRLLPDTIKFDKKEKRFYRADEKSKPIVWTLK